ncbi:hypothetical protein P154DRAFT_191818 [Amniculicola lignicola CBS 123094]|uniref:Zn(2)-C6 fungal-type domain-containing protein n=1 Tax=Amniculicola lignicola CBS 123094 TaxID=1392246 RepID=A0A6A5WJ59_9PLEO|nr:hypothetical protein P154DRAFT_191818 [Amniculicola lignicola CBS 123094]
MNVNFTPPSKACHNCRRRRWKCDRSLPVCQKCLSSGTECLGYNKLFVWNNGVASRGKMMGKSFEGTKGLSISKVHSQEPTPTPPPERNELVILKRTINAERGSLFTDDASPILDYVYHASSVVQWPLVDPLVQDLDVHSRYYVYHFANQLTVDMVVFDGPDVSNPIRDMIPAIAGHPMLLQVILANSAFHVFNISRDPITPSMYQEYQKPCLFSYYRDVTRFGGPFKSSYVDALVAKQEALSLLSQSVAAVHPSNIDFVLLSILLFINYDLVESGRDKWKVHMEGAKRLIKLMGTPRYQQHPMTTLRQCLLADLLVFSVLGSTMTHAAGCERLTPKSIDLEPILQYAETNNYLSCPAPLLRIMLRSFELPDTRDSPVMEVSSEIQEEVRQLLEDALAFDPKAWAKTFRPASPLEDLEMRARIAAAHRSAVCIYIARVLTDNNPLINPSSPSVLVSLTGLADDIISHVSKLHPSDPVFKCISWPLFLAGAETVDPTQRTWIMNKLDELYGVMYWGYIRTVKAVLERIWAVKDDGRGCWVIGVKEMGEELLIA